MVHPYLDKVFFFGISNCPNSYKSNNLPSAEGIVNIKAFDCNTLQVKKLLRQCAFVDEYTTEYRTEGNVKQ